MKINISIFFLFFHLNSLACLKKDCQLSPVADFEFSYVSTNAKGENLYKFDGNNSYDPNVDSSKNLKFKWKFISNGNPVEGKGASLNSSGSLYQKYLPKNGIVEVTLTVTNPKTSLSSNVTRTIDLNNIPIEISINSPSLVLEEGEIGEIILNLNRPLSGPLSVELGCVLSNLNNPASKIDFNFSCPTFINMGSGELKKVVELPILPDTFIEGTEVFEINIVSVNSVSDLVIISGFDAVPFSILDLQTPTDPPCNGASGTTVNGTFISDDSQVFGLLEDSAGAQICGGSVITAGGRVKLGPNVILENSVINNFDQNGLRDSIEITGPAEIKNSELVGNMIIDGSSGQISIDGSWIQFLPDRSSTLMFNNQTGPSLNGTLEITNSIIFDQAKIDGTNIKLTESTVRDNAQVLGEANLNNVIVTDNSKIDGSGTVSNWGLNDSSSIEGVFNISGKGELDKGFMWNNSKISGNVTLNSSGDILPVMFENSEISGNVEINGFVQMYGKSSIRDNVKISGGVNMWEKTFLSGNTKVLGSDSEFTVMLGSSRAYGDSELRGANLLAEGVSVFEEAKVKGSTLCGTEAIVENKVDVITCTSIPTPPTPPLPPPPAIIRNVKDYKGSKCSGQVGSPHVYGGGFVANTAYVSQDTFVGENAQVCDYAYVRGGSRIENFSFVGGRARVGKNVALSNFAKIFGRAQVFGKNQITISQNAMVYGNARIYGDSEVFGSANVFGEVTLRESARICGNSSASKDETITDSSLCSDSSPTVGDLPDPILDFPDIPLITDAETLTFNGISQVNLSTASLNGTPCSIINGVEFSCLDIPLSLGMNTLSLTGIFEGPITVEPKQFFIERIEEF